MSINQSINQSIRRSRRNFSANGRRPERHGSAPGRTCRKIRWVMKDSCGIELPPPAWKTIDLEGRVVKDGVRKALRDRQDALQRVGGRYPPVQEACLQNTSDSARLRLRSRRPGSGPGDCSCGSFVAIIADRKRRSDLER
jgi:hypothetical protein